MGRCRFQELRRKEVINQRNGFRIGFVDDLEINTESADLRALIIFGRCRFFGIFGREDDFVIPWQNIKLIGEDTILVDFCASKGEKREKRGFFGKKF
ncbi:MAG: YlmC/YmxH family sporulation protein [Oscillospiraceae bacterium]|nr:YlmC/YmxH family sporulation protein [Oscillospiraceae bacterium]